MADLTSFFKTDLVDDHVADDVNKLIAAALRAEYANTETISATRELSDTDCPYQIITCSGASRTIELAPEAVTNHPTIIYNTSPSNALVVQDDAGAITFAVLAADEWCLFLPVYGETWKVISPTLNAFVAEGRLTLASGTPVTTTDQIAKTTIYFSPYKGSRIALYDGAGWNVRTFAEISVAVPSTTSTPFDIFCHDNAGTPALETLSWTNDTTRATALTLQNGVLVKTGALTRRYLGTGRTTTVSGQTESSSARRLLWNYYNRVLRDMRAIDTTDSWTYSTASWRASNNNTTDGVGRVACVIGVVEDDISAIHLRAAHRSDAAAWFGVGIGINSTTANSGYLGMLLSTGANVAAPGSAFYNGPLTVGYNYIQCIEYGVTNATYYGQGTSPAPGRQLGMIVNIFG